MGSGTTELVYVPDWQNRARERVRTPWQEDRVLALAEALGAGAQLHEDQVLDLVAGTTLDYATGDALDQWGELVGEQRLALSDTAYRPFIKARMLVNRCGGTTEELLTILRTLGGPGSEVFHTSVTPPGAVLLLVRPAFFTESTRRRAARLMSLAIPAARPIVVIETIPGGWGPAEADDYVTSGFDAGPAAYILVDGL